MTLADLKKHVEKKTILVGTKQTLDGIRQKKVDAVYIRSTCSDSIKQDIAHHAKINDVSVKSVSQSSDELGVLCKKPFTISVVSTLKNNG